jgi:uncharacterized protein YdaU (DUF1376 family)
MIWYKFFLADYIKDTHHLDDAEDLCYRRLIDLYYLTEKPIPLDLGSVARKVRLDLDIVEAVLNEFFDRTEDGYSHSRCEREIKKYQHQASINRKLAKRSVASRSNQSLNQSATNGSPNQISDIREKNKNTSSAEPTRFGEFWSLWPASKRKVGKAVCEKKWAARDLDSLADQILSHVRTMKETDQWKEGFEPAPVTYLNQSRWQDDLPQVVIRRGK